jgi:hypothetical protein
MLRLIWRICRGSRLAPRRSPYLCWRLETYWGVPAEAITAGSFWKLSWKLRRDLVRHLRWADHMRFRHGAG